MLFRLQYVENHDLEKVHELLTYFFQKLQTATVWDKSLFPDWYHPIFDKNLKFQKETLKYIYDKVQELLPLDNLFIQDNLDERKKLYTVFKSSNDISQIFSNEAISVLDFSKLKQDDMLFQIFHKKAVDSKGKEKLENLLSPLYEEVLTQSTLISKELKLNNIKDHYIKFYNDNPIVCTFCGLEKLQQPSSVGRAAYDHYLDKTRYAFSSVNPRNLIPIGHDCNSSVKGAKNILVDEDGNRCLAFYPYEEREKLHFSIDCLTPPTAFNGGDWNVVIKPVIDSELVRRKIKTWDRVFNIIARYAEYIKKKANDLLKAILKKGEDITQNIERMIQNYKNEEHPFVLKGYDGYIPEKAFYEYCQSNPSFLSIYQVILNTNLSTIPVYSELD